MRLFEPPGLGNQWRALRWYGGHLVGADFGGVAQPSALAQLYEGVYSPLLITSFSTSAAHYVTFDSKNEDPPPFAILQGLSIQRVADANGVLVDPATAPKSTIYQQGLAAPFQAFDVKVTTSSFDRAITWEPTATSHHETNGGTVNAFSDLNRRFTLVQTGWFIAEPSLNWQL